MKRNTIIGLFFCLVASCCVSADDTEVKIEDGILKGSLLKSKSGRQFVGFRGIPYAKPPVGDLRFKAPVPAEGWEGVLDATKSRDVCIQRDPFIYERKGVFGSENCLHLNVYTPKLPTQDGKLLPVMVFIHGGAFFSGSGNSEYYGPEILLDRDIVLVAINYRLGPFGFLSTEDEVSPGNYGLKDQSLALKWVKKNIEKFGGDPNSITIFGESAGGASTHYQMLSPLSKGLFHRVISQSGSSLCTWAYAHPNENLENTKKLSKAVGCTTNSNIDMVQCLRNMDAAKILNQYERFIESPVDLTLPFKPVIEKPSSEAFISDRPENLIKSKRYSDVPLIVGLTTDEGLLSAAVFITNPKMFEFVENNFNREMGIFLKLKDEKTIESIGTKIRKFYFDDSKKLTKENDLRGMIDLYGDGEFTNCIDETIRLHLSASKSPIFTYLFAHNGGTSLTKILGVEENYGVCHADELQYLFGKFYGTDLYKNMTDNDLTVSDMFVTLWTNFARTGNPTPDETTKKQWKPTVSENVEYYNIDLNKEGMGQSLLEKRIKFWRKLEPLLKKEA